MKMNIPKELRASCPYPNDVIEMMTGLADTHIDMLEAGYQRIINMARTESKPMVVRFDVWAFMAVDETVCRMNDKSIPDDAFAQELQKTIRMSGTN